MPIRRQLLLQLQARQRTGAEAGVTTRARWRHSGWIDILPAKSVMGMTSLQILADLQVLHLTTVGRVTGLAREIEIWFIICRERFYLFSEHGEASGWVRNIRRNANVSVRVGRRRIRAT